jgi:hypothetical protein
MTVRQHIGMVLLLAFTALVSGTPGVHAAEPTRFTFTPTFQDPDPGKRQWEKRGTGYVETLPSGRLNTFRVQKPGAVNNLKGTILQKIEEPNSLSSLPTQRPSGRSSGGGVTKDLGNSWAS